MSDHHREARRATLSWLAVVLVAAAVGAAFGTVAALVVGGAGFVGLLVVGAWKLGGARLTDAPTLDECLPAERKRVRRALAQPGEIATLPRRLRAVTRATARQQVRSAAHALPWWVAGVGTYATGAVWRLVEAPARGSLLNTITAAFLLLSPALYAHQARKARAVLARFDADPALRDA